jgi:hypothetical protein
LIIEEKNQMADKQKEEQEKAPANPFIYDNSVAREPYVGGVPDEVTPEIYAHAKATTPPDMWPMYEAHFDERLKASSGGGKGANKAKSVEAGSAPTEPTPPTPAEEATAQAEKKGK